MLKVNEGAGADIAWSFRRRCCEVAMFRWYSCWPMLKPPVLLLSGLATGVVVAGVADAGVGDPGWKKPVSPELPEPVL